MDPNLRQRIINEAYKLFISKGIKHTSFCDIAVAVNKSKGAVMHYFPSKNQCKHSKKCTFYTLRFGCSFAAVNTIKPQLL